jgi:hypothetical protein
MNIKDWNMFFHQRLVCWKSLSLVEFALPRVLQPIARGVVKVSWVIASNLYALGLLLTSSGLESGQAVTECRTCVKVYGASATYCPSCLPCCKRESTIRRKNGDLSQPYTKSRQLMLTLLNASAMNVNKSMHWSVAITGRSLTICRIDISSPNNLYKHSHNSFVMSFGQNAWRKIIK